MRKSASVVLGAGVLAGAMAGGEGCAQHAAEPAPVVHPTTARVLEPTTAPAVDVVIFTPPATLPATAPATAPAVHAATVPADRLVLTHRAIAGAGMATVSSEPATRSTVAVAMSTTVPTTAPATKPATTNAQAPATAVAVVPTTAPADASTVFVAQMRRVLAGEAVDAEAMANLAPADRDAVRLMVRGFAKAAEKMRESGVRPAAGALIEMADKVRNLAPLQITTVALCTRVDDFGRYEDMGLELPAMVATNAVLYCELSGFTSRAGDRALWETRLLQEVSLEDEKGTSLWQDKPNTMADTCRNLRRDFYLARVIRLPENIPAGTYRLKVQVTDQLSHEVANVAVAVTYAAKP